MARSLGAFAAGALAVLTVELAVYRHCIKRLGCRVIGVRRL